MRVLLSVGVMRLLRNTAFAALAAATACSDAKIRSAGSDTAVRLAATPRADSAALLDDFGSYIDLSHAPKRIVSLNPTTTEILFAIGASNRLVGRSQWDTFPDSASTIASVGQALRPNVEAVLAVHPDLVVLYASSDNRPALEQLRKAGVTVVGFKIDSIAQFSRDTRLLGRIIGDSLRAATLVDSIEKTLARVRAMTASLRRPSVFIHAWDKPIIAIGAGSFMSQLLDIAGARNVYSDIVAPSATVTMEDLLQRNPDIVLASPTEIPKMRESAAWKALPAVRAGRALAYDTLLLSRPSVMLGTAAVSLANLLHPGVVR